MISSPAQAEHGSGPRRLGSVPEAWPARVISARWPRLFEPPEYPLVVGGDRHRARRAARACALADMDTIGLPARSGERLPGSGSTRSAPDNT